MEEVGEGWRGGRLEREEEGWREREEGQKVKKGEEWVKGRGWEGKGGGKCGGRGEVEENIARIKIEVEGRRVEGEGWRGRR